MAYKIPTQKSTYSIPKQSTSTAVTKTPTQSVTKSAIPSIPTVAQPALSAIAPGINSVADIGKVGQQKVVSTSEGSVTLQRIDDNKYYYIKSNNKGGYISEVRTAPTTVSQVKVDNPVTYPSKQVTAPVKVDPVVKAPFKITPPTVYKISTPEASTLYKIPEQAETIKSSIVSKSTTSPTVSAIASIKVADKQYSIPSIPATAPPALSAVKSTSTPSNVLSEMYPDVVYADNKQTSLAKSVLSLIKPQESKLHIKTVNFGTFNKDTKNFDMIADFSKVPGRLVPRDQIGKPLVKIDYGFDEATGNVTKTTTTDGVITDTEVLSSSDIMPAVGQIDGGILTENDHPGMSVGDYNGFNVISDETGFNNISKALKLIYSEDNPTSGKEYTFEIKDTDLASRTSGKYTCAQFAMDTVQYLIKNGVPAYLAIVSGKKNNIEDAAHAMVAIQTGVREIEKDGKKYYQPTFVLIESQNNNPYGDTAIIGQLGIDSSVPIISQQLDTLYTWENAMVFDTELTEMVGGGAGTYIQSNYAKGNNIYSYTLAPYIAKQILDSGGNVVEVNNPGIGETEIIFGSKVDAAKNVIDSNVQELMDSKGLTKEQAIAVINPSILSVNVEKTNLKMNPDGTVDTRLKVQSAEPEKQFIAFNEGSRIIPKGTYLFDTGYVKIDESYKPDDTVKSLKEWADDSNKNPVFNKEYKPGEYACVQFATDFVNASREAGFDTYVVSMYNDGSNAGHALVGLKVGEETYAYDPEGNIEKSKDEFNKTILNPNNWTLITGDVNKTTYTFDTVTVPKLELIEPQYSGIGSKFLDFISNLLGVDGLFKLLDTGETASNAKYDQVSVYENTNQDAESKINEDSANQLSTQPQYGYTILNLDGSSMTTKQVASALAKQIYGDDITIPQMVDIYKFAQKYSKDGKFDISKLGEINKELGSTLKIQEAGSFSVLPNDNFKINNKVIRSETFIPSVWDAKTSKWIEDPGLAGNSIKTIISGSDTEIPKSYVRNENSKLVDKINTFTSNFYKNNKRPKYSDPNWECVDYAKMMVDAAKKVGLPAYIATGTGDESVPDNINHAFVAFDLSGRMDLLEDYVPSDTSKLGLYAPQEFILYEPQSDKDWVHNIPGGNNILKYNHIDILKDPTYYLFDDNGSEAVDYNNNILRFRNMNYQTITGIDSTIDLNNKNLEIDEYVSNEGATLDTDNVVGDPVKKGAI